MMLGLLPWTLPAVSKPAADRELAAWVDQRIQERQPTKEERLFDDIGWAKEG